MEFYTSVYRLGSKLFYRGYHFGERVHKKVDFSPTLFVPTTEDTDWVATDDKKVAPMKFDSIREASEFIKSYDDVANFKVYGNTNFVVQYINEKFPGETIDFDINKIHIVPIDIEVMADNGFAKPEDPYAEINTITVHSNRDNKFRVFTTLDYSKKNIEDRVKSEDILLFKFDKEEDMLDAFMTWWVNDFPDVVTGWNIRMYDIPYIIARIERLFEENTANILSPWNKINFREVEHMGKNHSTFDILGVQQLDYMDLFQKFGYEYGPQPSYALDHIANVVVGAKKMEYKDRYGSLHNFMVQNPQEYVEYNIIDVDLINKMEEKAGLLALALTLAYTGGVNYNDVLGTTGIWDAIIYRFLYEKKVAIPPSKAQARTSFPGGYVKAPHIGMHDWVVSFDLNSLYPNLIVEYNMSPETLLPFRENVDIEKVLEGVWTNDKEYAIAANGACFDKSRKGYIPLVVETFLERRKTLKKSYIDAKKLKEKNGSSYEIERDIASFNNRQMAVKILMNSLYGAMGNPYFRYYELAIAMGITLSGQLTIKWGEKAVNKYVQKLLEDEKDRVIAMDTDSLYICLGDVVKKFKPNATTTEIIDFLDEACNGPLQTVIDKAYKSLHKTMGSYVPRMVMKRENIGERAIWTAKKRYLMNVWDSEGVRYSEPHLKMTGIEAVKSSTPQVCKDKFEEVFKIIMTNDESKTQKFIKDFKEEFKSLPPVDIAFPRGVSDIDKWWTGIDFRSGTPINSRAAIVHNNMIDKHNLNSVYEKIKGGDKIKFLYLKKPNPTQQHVVGFKEDLPVEFGLHKFVDVDEQFNKTFLDPLNIILDAINWTAKPQANLMSFLNE